MGRKCSALATPRIGKLSPRNVTQAILNTSRGHVVAVAIGVRTLGAS